MLIVDGDTNADVKCEQDFRACLHLALVNANISYVFAVNQCNSHIEITEKTSAADVTVVCVFFYSM